MSEDYPGQAYFHANNPNIKRAEESAPPAPPSEPWLYAIAEPSGAWHDGENCVFGDRESAQDEVDLLNDNLAEGEEQYKLVPLFRGAAPASERELRELIRASLRRADETLRTQDPRLKWDIIESQLVKDLERVLRREGQGEGKPTVMEPTWVRSLCRDVNLQNRLEQLVGAELDDDDRVKIQDILTYIEHEIYDSSALQPAVRLTAEQVMQAINYWRGYNGTLEGATAMLNAALAAEPKEKPANEKVSSNKFRE